MRPRTSRCTRKRPASPTTTRASDVDGSSHTDEALSHVTERLCHSGAYALGSHARTTDDLVAHPLCFLSTARDAADSEDTNSDRVQCTYGAALSRLAVESHRDMCCLSVRCEFAPLLLRIRPLTRVTATLLALPRQPGVMYSYMPLTDDGDRCGVPWSTCRAAAACVRRACPCDAVALLCGFPRVRLEAFATCVPPWFARGVSDDSWLGHHGAAADPRATAAHHLASLAPHVPPAFLARARSALADSEAAGWYVVRYTAGCPPTISTAADAVAASETTSSQSTVPAPYFLLPASLVATTVSLQIGERCIPPAHRPHARTALSHALAHATASMLPHEDSSGESMPVAYTVVPSAAWTTSSSSELVLCAASRLTRCASTAPTT